MFGSMLLLPAATEAQTAVQVKSTIIVTTTVFLDSTIPAGLPITCSVSVNSFDSVANNTAGGSNLVTRVGNKATCVTTITFLWEVASTTKTMLLTVNVGAGIFGTDQSRSTGISNVMIPLSTTRKSVTLAM
jgi:hypothetical protein